MLRGTLLIADLLGARSGIVLDLGDAVRARFRSRDRSAVADARLVEQGSQ